MLVWSSTQANTSSFGCARALPAVFSCSLQQTSCLISCSPSVKWRCNCCCGVCAWHRNQPSLSLSVFLCPSLFTPPPSPPPLGLKMPTWVECPFTGWVKIILISGILKTLRSFYVPSGFHSCHVELFRIIFFKESSQQRAQCTVSLAVSRTPRLPFWLQSHRSSPSEYFTSNPLHSASVPLLDWFEVFFFSSVLCPCHKQREFKGD